MHVPALIEKKRDGQELSADEIKSLIADFTLGEIPDYQMSAWAMAVYFRGMTPAETRHLTEAMMESGRVLKYPKDSPPKIDKHSTGGVGDKVSLLLAPLLYATAKPASTARSESTAINRTFTLNLLLPPLNGCRPARA